jgi:GTP-binding protein
LIRDLHKAGDEVVVLKGGRPGIGNHGRKEATPGEKGSSLELELTSQIQADIFLIGLPNSGKSTLMSRLTHSQASESTYPFATRSPELGVYSISDYEHLTLCELPSLYRASHEGRGRGTDFLKHLEGAKFILFMLDPFSKFAQTLNEGWEVLRSELKAYRESYLDIPCAVIVNKMDLAGAKEKVTGEDFPSRLQVPCFLISAKTGGGMDELTSFLKEKAGLFSHE